MYYWIENEINKAMQFLNGKVNTLMPATYNCSYVDSEICAGTRNGNITFYIRKINKEYEKFNTYSLRTWIIIIVTHELSHIDQDLDYDRYFEDKDYMRYIEYANDNRATDWISSNIQLLHQGLGDFDESLIATRRHLLNGEVVRYHYINKDLFTINLIDKYIGNRYHKYSNIYIKFFTVDKKPIKEIPIKVNGYLNIELAYFVIKNIQYIENNYMNKLVNTSETNSTSSLYIEMMGEDKNKQRIVAYYPS